MRGPLLQRFDGDTRFYDDFEPDTSHTRTESAHLAGGLLEWMPWPRLALGVNALVVDAHFERTGPSERLRVAEHDAEAAAYVLARPVDPLTLEASVARHARLEQRLDGMDRSQREDLAWRTSVRGVWMFGSVGGIDVGLWRLDRNANSGTVSGTDHRFTTRCVLQLGTLWASFGVGWDLEPAGESIYDGASGTIRATSSTA